MKPGPNALAVIIPMYNEQSNAEKCVLAVCQVLRDKLPSAKLFAVNDGSQDRTHEILERLVGQGLPFVCVQHEKNKGYGAALITGARKARDEGYEFGLMMDSDLTNDPALIPEFASLLKNGDCDLVKASRYVKGGGMQGVPLYRQLFTICGNKLASVLFNMGIKDCTNGFHAVRLSMICDQEFSERGFPILMEELLALKKQGARAVELPYILTSRSGDEGTSKFTYSWKTIRSYLKYALKASTVPYKPVR